VRFSRFLFVWIGVLLFVVPLTGLLAKQASGADDNVLEHLNHVITWYRRSVQICETVPAPGAAASRDELRTESVAALQHAFEYAQAQAAIAAPAPPAGQPATPGSAKNLQAAYDAAGQRIDAARKQIAAITAQISGSTSKKRADLLAQRDALNAELQINQRLQATLKTLLNYMTAAGEGGTGLAGKINDLLQSVPEARPGSQTNAGASNTAKNVEVFHPDSAGVLSLGIEIFTLMRGRVQLDQQVTATDTLLDHMQRLRTPIRDRLRSLLKQAQQLSSEPQSGTAAAPAKIHQHLHDLETEFSQTTDLIVPLSKEAFQLRAARANLEEWSGILQREYLTALRYLLLRFGEIAIVVVFILVLAEVWKRLTYRYVRETRLRRQMLLIRRIVMGFAISLTVVLSFITEFGSFATFAGFLTAGIAVALQNLILSVVAYFFLIGRYGARVGDRMTISGVTGEVIEVGLVRLYMMELSGSGSDLRPTGRIVVFSNSVLFQPAAIFKQAPGTNYSWHTATVTLSPDSDFDTAEDRLMKAANGVFATYRDAIVRQHAAFEQSVNLPVSEPGPERHVKYTDKGIEFSIRYPVELRRGAAIDEQMMKALRDAVKAEPKIHSSEGPKIQAG
jgi:small-conductance mechanosensitive channel